MPLKSGKENDNFEESLTFAFWLLAPSVDSPKIQQLGLNPWTSAGVRLGGSSIFAVAWLQRWGDFLILDAGYQPAAEVYPQLC